MPVVRTPLEGIIRRRIRERGGLTVADYMALCLTHPEHGYYPNRQPFGEDGDFITAPEASQMFGELIGIWAMACWRSLDQPERLHVIELGPGRGLLMADLLRAAASRPAFIAALDVRLVEVSPILSEEQRRNLRRARTPVSWHEELPQELPPGPVLIIANEFFDALPVHHYQRTERGWRERLVVIDEDGAFTFRPLGAPLQKVPAWARDLPIGGVIELSEERAAVAHRAARLVARHGGALLVIDYGHTTPGPGETLQAVHRHRRVSVFHRPGESDLTAHVDFAALADACRGAGLATPPPLEQGAFLFGLGLRERLSALLANADETSAARLIRGAERIAAPEHMGRLFKALCAHHPAMPTPPPFSAPAA